jgi:hypothetical protein
MIILLLLLLIISIIYYNSREIEPFYISSNQNCKPIHISENLILNPHSDKINCLGNWYNDDNSKDWSECNASCGGGTQYRKYKINTSASNGGLQCLYEDSASQTQSCNTHNCPQTCSGKWTHKSQCSHKCGSGTQSQIFIVEKPALYGGTNCSHLPGDIQTDSCYNKACPIDCLGHYSEWSECSFPVGKTCGNGSKTRTYNIDVSASNGGKECPYNTEEVECYKSCPLDCSGYWEPWSECNASCNSNGSQTQHFRVIQNELGGSCEYRNASKTQSCSGIPCPINCSGSFGDWSDCSASCNGGNKFRTYNIDFDKQNGGLNCSYSSGHIDMAICGSTPCPINCLGHWNKWSECSHTCGASGTETRDFVIDSPEQNDGTCTLSGSSQTRSCNTNRPCPINCVGNWQPWSECSKEPGQHTQNRIYNIITSASNSGFECPHEASASETQYCPYIPAPKDCHGNWGEWSKCINDLGAIVDCDGGTRTRQFIVTKPASDGGTCLLSGTSEISDCNTESCPIDCSGSFTEFSECNASCGEGTQHRTFIIENENYTGDSCSFPSGYVDIKTCNNGECPIECNGTWEITSPCNASCGGGTQQKTFISNDDSPICPYRDMTKVVTCNTQPCHIDCIGSWSDWSDCNPSCGNRRTRTQIYHITQAAQFGGESCNFMDKSESSESCSNIPCPIDCEGHWTLKDPDAQINWTSCDKSTGIKHGSREQEYIIDVSASNGGKECSFANHQWTTITNESVCDVNCEGEWSEVSECINPTCPSTNKKNFGEGTQERIYTVRTTAKNNGTECLYDDGTVENNTCTKKAPTDNDRCTCTSNGDVANDYTCINSKVYAKNELSKVTCGSAIFCNGVCRIGFCDGPGKEVSGGGCLTGSKRECQCTTKDEDIACYHH